MKFHRTKIIIAASIFIVGVFFAAVWLLKFYSSSELIKVQTDLPDLNIHSIKFCDLIRESKQYDGKIVRIRALYKQGYEASFLGDSDCKDLITISYSPDNKSLDKMSDLIFQNRNKSSQLQIEVVGQYHDSEYDDFDDNVHLIEILEMKDAKILQTSQ